MRRIIILFLSIGALLSMVACSKKTTMTWQEQYDLGVRYLSEGNYKEAIIAFKAAITIDPQQADGYVHLAEAYIYTNDFENATRVVNQGIEACGESDSFTFLLNQIRISELLQNGVTDNMLQREELNFFGHGIDTLSFQESTRILQQRGYERNGMDQDWDGKIDFFSVDAENDTLIDIEESSDRIEWRYVDVYQNAKYPIGIRDISTCDTMADVFTKLGFSNGQEISACIMDISESGTGTLVLPEEFFVQKYIAEDRCVLLDVNSRFANIWLIFQDADNDVSFSLDLSFGHSDSSSLLDCLIRIYLVRVDVPAAIADAQNGFG